MRRRASSFRQAETALYQNRAGVYFLLDTVETSYKDRHDEGVTERAMNGR